MLAETVGCTDRAIRQRAAREGWAFTEQTCRGGRRRLYALDQLPAEVRARVILAQSRDGSLAMAAAAVAPVSAAAPALSSMATPAPRQRRSRQATDADREALWAWFTAQPGSIQDEARRRLPVVLSVRRLLDAGTAARLAIDEAANAAGESPATVRRWWYGEGALPGVATAHPSDYLPLLAPRYRGRVAGAEISPEAWAMIKADFLRPEQPSISACYRRAQGVAGSRGWQLPSLDTVERLIAHLPWQVVTLLREGGEALERKLPHIERTREFLRALEAVNADGHVFDLMVTLPSGKVGRPVLVAWQDISTSKLVAWRCGETLSSHLVRLAFGDLVERYGVPEHVYLDNGREFASKALTGGTATRYRFRVRDEDPVGLFTQLGVQVHWTRVYHGQSKPIERAFRDLCETISKHPAAAGAYTGNSPVTKPANYGSRALTWDEFTRLVDAGIAAHNAQTGRRGSGLNGRSFDQAFDALYQASVVRRPTAEQRRLWLLAADGVTVRQTGHVAACGNLYWGEALGAYTGRKVVVRYDPDRLAEPVHVYTLDGAYIGAAERTTARFNDTDTAREHARANKARLRAAKDMAAATVRRDALAAAAELAPVIEPETPAPAAVQLIPARRVRRDVEPLAATGTDGGYVASLDDYVRRSLRRRDE
jgi:hypothetical protein